VTVPAPPTGATPTMLGTLDLPAAVGVDEPWVGSTPGPVTSNAAATVCDHSTFTGSFRGHPWTKALTRSFVVPDGGLAASFGITETIGRLSPAAAVSFVGDVRSKLASCPHRELGTKVVRLGGGPTWSAWRLSTQVSKQSTLAMYMGVVRAGGSVAQVGFVADGTHTIAPADFQALVRRAGERLGSGTRAGRSTSGR
jgi:hypothetical protein